MNHQPKINSREWWEAYFADHWEQNKGREQTQFFADLAITHLPDSLKDLIVERKFSILDWGCAEGDGTHLLAERFPDSLVVGMDFSATAINRAWEYYPNRIFTQEDLDLHGRKYDVTYTSNCLEHFENPLNILSKILEYTGSYSIILIPFNEENLMDQHLTTFRFSSFPVVLGDFQLVYHKVIDTRSTSFWPGRQLLLVYAHRGAADLPSLTLSLYEKVHQEWEEAVNRLDSELASARSYGVELEQKIRERDAYIAALKNQNEELQRVLQGIHESVGWKIAKTFWFIKDKFLPRESKRRKAAVYIVKTLRKFRRKRLRSASARIGVLRVREGGANPFLPRFYGRVKDYFVLRDESERRVRVPGLKAPSVETQEGKDIFFWGVIDWHYRIQRPQHLARGLAEKGFRVFYFSPDFIESETPWFECEALDDSYRLFNVRIGAKTPPIIYNGKCESVVLEQLVHSLKGFLEWASTSRVISIVQHPFWFDLARQIPNHLLIYDCLDHHFGFGNNSPDLSEIEGVLMEKAHLMTVTSKWLYDIGKKRNSRIEIINNACDYQHFSMVPQQVFKDRRNRKVIGYHGAIAEWFDLELVEKIARDFPDCSILLIGRDSVRATERLSRFGNVMFTGEVPYERLPYYLHSMDVCMVPFRLTPLTIATDPVKVYEYLSAGKPVVSVDLPELRRLGSVVHISSTYEGFRDRLRFCLSERSDDEDQQRRKDVALKSTWGTRVDALVKALSEIQEPLVSIVVVTYNNLHLTQKCLESIEWYSDYPNYEVIIVDNASGDGTQEYLSSYAVSRENWRVVQNVENRGFPAACNQGLAMARGEYLVILNNDTVVTSGWVRSLLGHLRYDSSIGIIGPLTNQIGNEAMIPTDYRDLGEMHQEARSIAVRNMGRSFDIPMLAFFCVMIPKHVFDKVGPLDEAFGIGWFEDDDYCQRIRRQGYRVVCAEDVFVHHAFSASFNKLEPAFRDALFEKNKKLYEAKWGKWRGHSPKVKPDYNLL